VVVDKIELLEPLGTGVVPVVVQLGILNKLIGVNDILGMKNYREMSDEELVAWNKKSSERGVKEDPTEAHRRALLAMQNPTRREILALLRNSALTTEEIAKHFNLDEKVLGFHLQFLESTFFVTVEGNMVDLTPLGVAYTRHVITED
jgi:DNA-binding transcriptional ArsR family regulator